MSTPSFHASCRLHVLISAGLALFCGTALAHPGHLHEASSNMLSAGLLHPLTGLDHLLAMLAVGMWASMTQKNIAQSLWTPISFACLLLAGAIAGIAGARLSAVEPVIVASLFVLGLLLTCRVSLPKAPSAVLVSFFAVFHGIAHGSELPDVAGAAAFVTGFMFSTLCLHAAGLATGFALKHRAAWLPRLAGAGIAAYGVALYASAV
jgi:urease accessory protein